MNLMAGKTGLIMGVANERSIAWGIANELFLNNANVILTYQNDSLKKRIIPLSEKINCKNLYKCDVSLDLKNEYSIENLIKNIKKDIGDLDFVVHALAYSDKDELKGKYIETSRTNFLSTLDISTYSFTRVAKSASKIMRNGGSLLTLTYAGSNKTTPNYNVMGVAKAALETSVKYLSVDLGKNNIRVNAISAGPMKTIAGAAISGARHVYKYSEKVAPLKKNPDLEQVGNAALYLLSDISSGVTGLTHYVDGGLKVVGIPNQDLVKI
ncbi:enoyl-ACP reductase [Alphaproteobacteria bacterium]|nr:enoyl-ACP reductase [Alphaproteobacteria bacterium]